ncbi:hypothetical protein KY284_036757 [Solanum tuberosum]|nr:hypothetical protein KY284_036757 [Solanum tuberosum]
MGSSKELSNGSSSVKTHITDNNPKEDCNGKAVLLGENAATNTLFNKRNTVAGHVEKMEVLTGIADLKEEIGTYLASFDPSKPVTSADVHKIFENLAQT